MKEQVLVFPTSLLKEIDFEFEGFKLYDHENDGVKLNKLLFSDKLFYMDRDEAEKDPNFKQLIPYMVIYSKDKVFCYKRTKKSGEKRLHDLYSLGIGGHINPSDSNECPEKRFENGMFRELSEEVDIKPPYSNMFYGFINDNSNDVGKVHFGVCMIIQVQSTESVKLIDPVLKSGEFEEIHVVKKNSDLFENWSKLVIESL